MMSLYANQPVTLKSKSTVNEYNESTYATSTIYARFEYNRKLIRNAAGEEIMATAVVFTKSVLKLDDMITFDSRDWNVVSVSTYYDLFGSIVGYEAGVI